MSNSLRMILILVGLFLMVIVLGLVFKKKLPIKYSLFWFFSALVILLVGAVPGFVGAIKNLFGFETTSNLVIGIIIGLLLLITMVLTVIVSEQKRRITILIQEVSILKENINKNKE